MTPEQLERRREGRRARYAADPEYRERVLQRKRELYATDPKYREQRRKQQRDPAYQERKRIRERERYAAAKLRDFRRIACAEDAGGARGWCRTLPHD
jgi:hypothetical protein